MQRYNNYHKHDHVSNIFSPDSNARAEDYIKKCVEYGHTNYFTTNHGSFGDIFEARTLCNKYGLRCIAGIEGYIVPNPLEKDKRNYHIIVIPKTDTARKKMNYISTHANTEGYYYKPRFFIQDLLALDPDDIYITTACVMGLLHDQDSFKYIFMPLYEHFKKNMLLEVQPHNHITQIDVNKRAVKLSKKYDLSLIAANDSHYIDEKGRQERLELLKGKNINYGDEDTFILDFPTAETMFDRFKNQGILTENEIESAINNTLIFDNCEEIQLDYSIKMPTIYPNLSPKERVDVLKQIINKNFAQIRKEENITGEELEKYKEGIRYEMKIIEDTNDAIHTADYFLFNTKNVALAVNKYHGVLTRGGRGSCASFYINRILGLTQLDRFKINLPIYPDRFASTARLLENRSLPDIDMNVKEQEPFVAASRELLGKHGCYPMYAPGTMQLAEAFRNVCRSKNMPYDTYNDVCKNIENYENDPEWIELVSEAKKYVGTIISGSVHPCAFLLSDKDIRYEYGLTRLGDNLCVLITSSEADEYKVLKNDYLIVKVWKLIDETFQEIGSPILSARELLEKVKDDERVWALFSKGLTCTLNQVDSDNGMQQAKQYGIKSFEDGALIAAAIRPSFDAWRPKFLNHEDYTTGSEDLDNTLKQTKHYILFQENLMQYFEWLGVTPAESIGLIKKISKKKIKPDDFNKLEERLKKNWVRQTGSENMFEETWEMIQGCMAYGFASPHACATSLDMLYGAYLKVNYPLEYYTVCFNNYEGDEVRTNKLKNELRYFGIQLSGISFRNSRGKYSYDKEKKIIYKGLSSIKYMSSSAADELYSLKDNQYDSFVDLLIDIKKLSLDARQLEILIKLNFFAEFGEINELLEIVKIFDVYYGKKQLNIDKLTLPVELVSKHCGKRTDKMFKELDSLGLIKDIIHVQKFSKTSILDKIKYENEFLGYIQTVLPKINEDYYYVQNVSGFNNNTLTLYQIKTGNIITVKNRSKKEIKKDSMVKIPEMIEDFKWKKDGKKWIRIDDKEMVVKQIALVS